MYVIGNVIKKYGCKNENKNGKIIWMLLYCCYVKL